MATRSGSPPLNAVWQTERPPPDCRWSGGRPQPIIYPERSRAQSGLKRARSTPYGWGALISAPTSIPLRLARQ
jgi:hypothetical protein